jgi:hypothetical protein
MKEFTNQNFLLKRAVSFIYWSCISSRLKRTVSFIFHLKQGTMFGVKLFN